MTKKELERISKRLVAELPGFQAFGQMLFMTPLGSTLKALYFDRSHDARRFYVQVLLEPLFVPVNVIGFNIGWRLGGECQAWDADSPDLIADLSKAIKRDVLPFFSGIESAADVAGAARSLNRSDDPYVQQAIAYSLARAGDVEQANAELERLESMLSRDISWQRQLAERAERLRRMITQDEPAAQRQLSEWESESLTALGLSGIAA